MSEQNLNIYQKLAKIRKMTEAIQKNKKGFSYMYVTEDVILAKVTAGMESYNVSLIPSITPATTKLIPYNAKKTKVTKEGQIYEENVNEILIQADMMWRWVNNDDPTDYLEIPWTLVGHQSNASMSLGSGLTYTSRYFLLKYFNVATVDDDPDNWKAKQEEASKQEEMTIVKALIEKIDVAAKLYMKNNPESSAVLEATLKKVVKVNGKASANYFKIEDAETAANTLKIINELNEKKENK